MENTVNHLVYQWLLNLGIAENIAGQVQFALDV
jgi:hypothetical protein